MTWKNLKAGDRIELVATNDEGIDWAPGTRGVMVLDAPAEACEGLHIKGPDGTVIESYHILSPRWDNGSWLQMIPETGDEIKKIDHDAVCPKCSSTENVTDVDFNVKPEGGWWVCSACDHKFEHRVVVKIA